MYVLKKFIIKEWFKFFVASFFILFLLLTAANLISGFLRGNVTSSEVVLNYFLELPSFLSKIFPISCLVSSLFTTNKFILHSELTAMFAGGYPRKQFLADIFVAALVVASVQFLTGAYLQPFLKSKRHVIIGESAFKFRNLKSKGLNSSTIGAGKLWYKSGDYYFSFVAFDKVNNVLNNVALFSIDKNYLIKEKIFAKKATYLEKNLWQFEDLSIISNLNGKNSLPEHNLYKTRTLPLNETPHDLGQIESDITTLNIHRLFDYIRTLKESGINTSEYEIILLDKISTSLICIIFALIGAIAIFNPNRRANSFGRNVLIIFIFTIFYWLLYSYSLELGKNSKINPYLACFSSPILFGLFLSYYFNKHKKLC